MKTKLAAACVIMGTMLVPVAAHAEDRDTDRTHPLTFVKDSVITIKIKAKLADERMGSLAHIKVDTSSQGEVMMSGTVRTAQEADKAYSLARATEGVTSVFSTVRVKKDD